MYSFIQYNVTNPVLLEANIILYHKFKEDPDKDCNTEMSERWVESKSCRLTDVWLEI